MKFTKDEIRKSMLLYAVTDRTWLKEGESLVSVCKAVLENGATFLQIRENNLDAETFEHEAEQLKELCAAYHVPFVVNDSVEIAMNIDADGVHVGQSDIRGRDIRAMTESAELFKKAFHLEGSLEKIAKEMNALMDLHYHRDIPLKNGVRAYLEELHQSGTKMCVASATAEPLMEAYLMRVRRNTLRN